MEVGLGTEVEVVVFALRVDEAKSFFATKRADVPTTAITTRVRISRAVRPSLLEEVRSFNPDETTRTRLKEIYQRSIEELASGLSDDSTLGPPRGVSGRTEVCK